LLGFKNQALGFFDCLHDRRVAIGVFVDANTEIDLFRVVIGTIGGHQAQNRIGR
jgi:hypothetical protein